MSAALDGAVELLERSLADTRVALADVRPELLARATPCAGWVLADLLAHMEDALDAFTEAAAGRIDVAAVPDADNPVEALRDKACALLGAWAGAATADRDGTVAVGDVGLDAPLLVATAALEITLHGWDVAQATGRRTPLPEDLARGLLAIARAVIDPSDRGPRFAGPRPAAAAASYGVRLLAFSGRSAPAQMTGPRAGNQADPRTRRGLAS